jgi:hypothetical protein
MVLASFDFQQEACSSPQHFLLYFSNVCCIDYRAMFTSGLNETILDRIVMHEMEFSALRDVIYFFYTAQIKVRYK